MRSRRELRLAAVLLPAAIFVTVMAGMAVATPGFGTSTTPLGGGVLEDLNVNVKTDDWKLQLRTKGASDVAASEIRVAPGGYFGWHSHPGPSIVIVKSGTSTFYRGDDPDCTPERHPAGSAYVDPGGDVHTARNEEAVELVLLVVRIMPQGATPRIDQPSPGYCNF